MRALVLLVLLAGCADLAAVDARLPESTTEPPALLPLGDILALADAQGVAAPDADPDLGLAARAAALEARAAALRGPVLTEAERARLALQ